MRRAPRIGYAQRIARRPNGGLNVKLKPALAAAFTTLLLASCSSTTTYVDTGAVREGESSLGTTTGSSQGLMILQVFPLGQNERFQRAYDQALAQYPGATRLANLVITESWWSAFFVNGYTYKVTGEAIQ